MHLLTRSSNNEIIEEKTNMALTSHYESVVSDKQLYRKIGVNLTNSVTLKGGQQVTVQQALCSIPSSGGEQLFTGVECMGNTETVVFTFHKKHNEEARKTVYVLHKVLQGILEETSYDAMGTRLSPTPTPELEAMQQQENNYLDGILNLHHYSEIDLTKKRKMDDDTEGARTAVSGLTNVSPQSHTTTCNAWTSRNVQRKTAAPAQHMDMDFKTAEVKRMENLEEENKRQRSALAAMENKMQQLQESVETLFTTKAATEHENARRAQWETEAADRMRSTEDRWNRQEEQNNTMLTFLQQILSKMNPQMGQTSTPPANLKFTNNSLVTSVIGQHNLVIPVSQPGQHSDSSPSKSEKI